MKSRLFLFLFLFLNSFLASYAQYEVTSPDGTIYIKIDVNENIKWSVSVDGHTIMGPSSMGLTLDGKELIFSSRGIKPEENKIDEIVKPTIPRRQKVLQNNANELSLHFRNGQSVDFRAYNYGVAYRFRLNGKKEVEVTNETMHLEFPEKTRTFFPQEESFISHNERLYIDTTLTALNKGKFCSLPVLVKPGEINVVITDADLYDYPNMFLKATGKNSLDAIFPKVVLQVDSVDDRNEKIIQEADYIARTSGRRTLPWRSFTIARKPGGLIEHDLVYVLSRPGTMEDTGWIKPGRVAWDWYNALNLYNVDFASGINTKTYKYYIDFASKYGLEYIILDEGWSKTSTDLSASTADIDLKELIDYGKSKNVGIILWALWKPLVGKLQANLDLFSQWGVKGVKMDFMQRGDQGMVNIYERVAKECAKRHLLIDYHGAFKPSGLQRAYPNFISNEGVKGSENNKWSADITPEHNLTIPFIRMLAGPMDYTPGVMVNAQKINHHISFMRPVSLGTRAHQVAMYVVFESPLQMFADSPSNYLADPECTEFMARIPVTWDETRVLQSSVGDYVILARRNGSTWYMSAMTNRTPREWDIKADFLGESSYKAEIFSDGINASKFAEDYSINTSIIKKDDTIHLRLAPGGGWIAILTKN